MNATATWPFEPTAMSADKAPPQDPNAQESSRSLNLLGELEERLGQLKAWQSEREQNAQELRGQADALDRQRAELENRTQELSHYAQEVDQVRADLKRNQAELEKQKQQIDQAWDAVNQQKTLLEQRLEELEADRVSVAAECEKEKEQQLADLAGQREEVEAKQAEWETSRGKLDDHRGQVEQLKAKLEQGQQQLEADRVYLKLREGDLDAQQEQIEQVRRQLAAQAAKHGGVPDGEDQADLEAQLERLSERQEQLERDRRELDEQRSALEQKSANLDGRESGLTDRADELDTLKVEIDQGTTGIEQGRAESKRQGTDLDRQADELKARSEQLEKQTAELEEKQNQYRQALQKSKDQMASERDQAKQKQKDLQKQGSELKKEQEKVTKQTARLKLADDAVQKRRQRVRRNVSLLRQRSRQLKEADRSAALSSAQQAGLEKERQMLVEVKRFLTTSEGEMIQRWATTKAWSLVVGGVFTLLLLAWFSYAVGQQLVEPLWQATMAMEMVLPEEDPNLTPQAWLNYQRETILGEAVLREAISQMNRRSVRIFSGPQALAEELQQNLRVTGKLGRVELAYHSIDSRQVVAVLAAVGRAFLGYQLALDRAAGRSDTTRIAQAATRDARPVTDDRLKIAGITMGATCLAAVVVGVVFQLWLRRVKRTFIPA